MTNLDREELRNRLKTVHESQGIRKSVAMKLMQELDETVAKWRKEWGRANDLQNRLDSRCNGHPTGDCIIQELQGKLDDIRTLVSRYYWFDKVTCEYVVDKQYILDILDRKHND